MGFFRVVVWGFFPLPSVCTGCPRLLASSADVHMAESHGGCATSLVELMGRREEVEQRELRLNCVGCRLAIHVVAVCKKYHSMQKRQWDLSFHLEKRMISLLHLV